MTEQPKNPTTNFGKLVTGPRGMKGVEAAKNPDALAAWISFKREQAKKKAGG